MIGHHSLVNSCAVVLMGACLPDRSVLDANSTLLPAPLTSVHPAVYSGSPAIWQAETRGAWFDRTDLVTVADIIEGPMGPDSDSNPTVTE